MRRNRERIGVPPTGKDWLHRAEERGRNPLTRTAVVPAARPRVAAPLAPELPVPGAEATAIRYPYGITDYQDLLNKINAIEAGGDITAPLQINSPVPADDEDALLLIGENALVGGDDDGTVIGTNQPAGFEGDLINLQVDGDTVFLVEENGDVFARQGNFTITDAVNTGPATPLRISHRLSAGAAATGFSTRMEFNGEDDGGGAETMVILSAQATNTTDAAFSSNFEVLVRGNGGVQSAFSAYSSPTLDGVTFNVMIEAQQGIGIDFVQAASLGSLVGVFEVFDAFTQASRGYVPIYDGFTPP